RGRFGPVPAAQRAVYYPATYAVAEQRHPPAAGYDVGHDPERGPALRRARDTGRATATSVMPLLIGGHGVTVYRPGYGEGAPVATVAERRQALLGFAAGAFKIGDLASAAVAALPGGAAVQLRDRGSAVLGGSEPLDDAAAAPITIANRTWT